MSVVFSSPVVRESGLVGEKGTTCDSNVSSVSSVRCGLGRCNTSQPTEGGRVR